MRSIPWILAVLFKICIKFPNLNEMSLVKYIVATTLHLEHLDISTFSIKTCHNIMKIALIHTLLSQ